MSEFAIKSKAFVGAMSFAVHCGGPGTITLKSQVELL